MSSPPSAELPLPGEAQSAPAARRFLARTLDRWDSADLVPTASLLLSELVANAVLHAKTPILIRVAKLADGLRLEVTDRSPRIPVQRHYQLDATTGRGMALVTSLARSWGVEPGGLGKTVWCELSSPESTVGRPKADVAVDLDSFPDLDDRLPGTQSGDGSVGPGRAADEGRPERLGQAA
jgi:anti-sigma regulatory factor (Ser/Thr protein kinase)